MIPEQTGADQRERGDSELTADERQFPDSYLARRATT
jgi:hypothetical protein